MPELDATARKRIVAEVWGNSGLHGRRTGADRPSARNPIGPGLYTPQTASPPLPKDQQPCPTTSNSKITPTTWEAAYPLHLLHHNNPFSNT